MNTNNVSPPKVLIISFLIFLLTGTLLLYLPVAVKTGSSDFMTALFTATSALCVTGLVTVNTIAHWSVFGQVVILLLIQVGGLGVMTFATFFVLLLGQHINLKQKLVMQYTQQSAIARIENGMTMPTLTTLRKIGKALNAKVHIELVTE